jgi:hypothetical protein
MYDSSVWPANAEKQEKPAQSAPYGKVGKCCRFLWGKVRGEKMEEMAEECAAAPDEENRRLGRL